MKNIRTASWIRARAIAVKPGSFLASLPIAIAVTAMIPSVCYAQQAQNQPQAAKVTRPATRITSNDELKEHLIAEEKASWDLAIKRDATSYKALHAPDFFTVSGTGITDRELSEDSALDSHVHFDRCDLSEFSVRFVAENAALITYRAKAAGTDHGKAFQLDSCASSLWVKRDGKWLNVFYQATPAAAH
jgi:hypothetical protein